MNISISEIEALSFEKAQEMAQEVMQIKEHDCVFVDFGGYFGYSVLVYKDGKHVYYANDYQLHHEYLVREQGKDALREYFIKKMNRILFTDAELLGEVSTYDEYERKSYFLRNYWIMRYDYVSSFYIGKEQKEEIIKAKKKFPYYNPVSFCWVQDENIVDASVKYLNHLKKAYKKLKSNAETFREMIRAEFYNHEVCVTGSATDALNALGLKYDKLTDEQKKIVNEELRRVS